MKCPNCEEVLVMAERQGVEIDYCPRCRGVWLDKGELDKIIEKSAAFESGNSSVSDPFREHRDRDRNDQYQKDPYYGQKDQYYGRKKKKGFLGDFFDFD